MKFMRQILLMAGWMTLLLSCANNEGTTTNRSDSLTSHPNNPTTGSGAAGTGGVGAGFGAGGSPTTDTGKVVRTDTSGTEKQQ